MNTIYDDMWQRFSHAMTQNQYVLDSNILTPTLDTRRGITALGYIDNNSHSVAQSILEFQQAIKKLEPEQYFHTRDELHLTVLSIISCISGFQLSDINSVDYIRVFQSAMAQAEPIEVHYKGITASENCIVIQGFPVNDCLMSLRESLRQQLVESGLLATFDSRYKLTTAHCSLIRFCCPLQNSTKLLDFCVQYRDHNFGTVVFTDFELVFNNWYQNLSVTKSLSHCSLMKQ